MAAARFGAELRATAWNFLWKALSASLEKVCRLALVLASAPVIGQAAFGRFQFATTVTAILALVTDLGLGLWTTRALARGVEQADAIVGTTLRTRALCAAPYAAATLVIALAVGPGEARAAVLLLGISALCGAFVDHFAAVLRGQGRFRDEARLNVTRALAVAAAGFGALWAARSLVALVAGVAAGTLAAALVGVALLRRPLRGPFDARLMRTAVRESLPIWLAGVFSILYFRGDTVLLRWLAGDLELGAYGAAWKMFEGSQLLPAMIMAATFPPLARAAGDPERRRRWERLVAALLLGLGLAVGLVFFAARTPIIAALFGPAFAPAVPSLAALACAVPLMFLNCGLTHFLIARDLARLNLVFAAALLPLNVGVNLWAIPRWGGRGAGWATVATEAALTLFCLWGLRARGGATAARTAA